MDLYTLLPAVGEPELIHASVPPGGAILDLGAGVGRIADPLVDLGHPVVAVDESAEMLARVRAARTIDSRIGDLRLAERLDAVIMASHLANTPDTAGRRALFAAARRHLKPAGAVLVQWHPPEWFDGLAPGTGRPTESGAITSTLDIHSLDDGLLTATVSYRHGADEWTQWFQARRLTVDDLAADLAEHGLTVDRFLTDDRTWLRLTISSGG